MYSCFYSRIYSLICQCSLIAHHVPGTVLSPEGTAVATRTSPRLKNLTFYEGDKCLRWDGVAKESKAGYGGMMECGLELSKREGPQGESRDLDGGNEPFQMSQAEGTAHVGLWGHV